MEKDLVLVSRAGQWNEKKDVKVILPNIKGQKYTLGSKYPGEREGEEFVFARNQKGLLDPTDSVIISVDDKGQYWIQNDTKSVEGEERTTRSSVSNTFVNKERVKALEKRLLKSGDKVSLGGPATFRGLGRQCLPTFCVMEREIIGGSRLQMKDNDNESCASSSFADSPLANTLILSEVMTYLPVKDLKKARLVCKKWREEASKALEKRGAVSFNFSDYLDPDNSTKIFRYLHEMRDMKVQNLHLHFDSDPTNRYRGKGWTNDSQEEGARPSPFQKMMDDLRKLLHSSHNFLTLVLKANLNEESGFLPFCTVFQELGGKLVELTLHGELGLLPEINPPFPVMNNLKKFSHRGYVLGGDRDKVRSGWVSLLVPLFSNSVETFTCGDDVACWQVGASPYLEAFLNQDMPNLRGIAIEGRIRKESVSPLLLLQTPLTHLKIVSHPESMTELGLLESLLSKFSQSLETLVIVIEVFIRNNQGLVDPEVKFPSFPNLKELELEYGRRARISWETGLDYEDHFPSLRKITVRARHGWRMEDAAFNALFPEGGNLRSETVEEVWVPVLPKPNRRASCWYAPDLASFQPRMDQIRNMFPTAREINFFQ